jgi:hypothetical protein
MGGGLVGSILCFVPDSEFAAFKTHMAGFYGEGKIVEVAIPPLGAHEVK